jgi:hypothetical protein
LLLQWRQSCFLAPVNQVRPPPSRISRAIASAARIGTHRRYAGRSPDGAIVTVPRPRMSDSSSPEDDDGTACEACGSEEAAQMLLCDGCNRGYHMYCLPVKLSAVPKGNWYCPVCTRSATAAANWRTALSPGYAVRARDRSGKWLEGKVVHAEGRRVRVHFLGWNAKYDEWFDKQSANLEPLAGLPGAPPLGIPKGKLVQVPAKRPAPAAARPPAVKKPSGPLQMKCLACAGRHVAHICGKQLRQPSKKCLACQGRHVAHTCGKVIRARLAAQAKAKAKAKAERKRPRAGSPVVASTGKPSSSAKARPRPAAARPVAVRPAAARPAAATKVAGAAAAAAAATLRSRPSPEDRVVDDGKDHPSVYVVVGNRCRLIRTDPGNKNIYEWTMFVEVEPVYPSDSDSDSDDTDDDTDTAISAAELEVPKSADASRRDAPAAEEASAIAPSTGEAAAETEGVQASATADLADSDASASVPTDTSTEEASAIAPSTGEAAAETEGVQALTSEASIIGEPAVATAAVIEPIEAGTAVSTAASSSTQETPTDIEGASGTVGDATDKAPRSTVEADVASSVGTVQPVDTVEARKRKRNAARRSAEDIATQFVTDVEIRLHESFVPSIIRLTRRHGDAAAAGAGGRPSSPHIGEGTGPPWQVTREGWGMFSVPVRVGMKGHPSSRKVEFTHLLNFVKPETKKHYEIDVVTVSALPRPRPLLPAPWPAHGLVCHRGLCKRNVVAYAACRAADHARNPGQWCSSARAQRGSGC